MTSAMTIPSSLPHYSTTNYCKMRVQYRKARQLSLTMNSIRHKYNNRGLRPVRSTHSIRTRVPYKKDFIRLFPYEITCQIISYLDINTLCELFTVSKTWYQIARSDQAWKTQFYQHFKLINNQYSNWYEFTKHHAILNTRWDRGQVMTHYLLGHLDSVYCLQFDKRLLFTGSRDRTVKIWDLCTYQCIHTLYGHDASVLCLRYDDELLVTGSSDTTLIVWSMRTRQPISRLTGHMSSVLDICLDSNYIISCSKDSTIRVWDRHTFELIRTIVAHRGPVNAIELVGRKLVSASGVGLIKMWDIATGECLRKYVGHTRGLACVKYDGKRIVSGSNDRTIKVWDAESGKCLLTLEGHTGLVRALCFNEERIISASYDQNIRVWDMKGLFTKLSEWT
ncbi:hypothetical protein G6F46_006077 [Rhizopus delemar]|uniref:F-box domain-containing protein n=2 Tax=Rhizopus TaxID=4842 RepID=A0A9P7CQA4_9FUNG|nr:hypothetical protein G6F55_004537 [Rhizopus delemar]KAG1544353.1 hypothetical protein G6F51_006111 [Rhizopus arrhizus]KAG1498096.1 hypothetical protein G6F54_005313 [Rhizopus delemar]KAG1512648.1 hypothetical protein G6F53_005024 [Rhizopus delemar]KAG1525874.1 hypothetical protein G6F52_002936 [Rhizopus delemar]